MSSTAINQEMFAAAVRSMAPDNLSATRKAAAATFSALGFPTQKHEQWKYTNLQPAAELSNDWLEHRDRGTQGNDATPDAAAGVFVAIDEIDAHWITLRNGIVDPDCMKTLTGLASHGVTISPLSTVGKVADIHAEEPLSAFNAALLRDGLSIRVAGDCTIDKPLALLAIDDGSQSLSQSRVIINCDAGASLKVIELARSAGKAQFANAVSQANLAKGAALDYVRIQERDAAHIGINRLHVMLNDGAQFRHSAADFGNALARNDVVVDIAGADATAELHGLYLAAETQHIDNHLHVIHRVGPARSMQDYRGILNGHSRCVFNGKVEVMQGADGTDAQQSNRNLLLSDRAEVDTKPELEIYADDVKCSHGATVGQLDESAIFYLRSRGLSYAEARHILTRAFATAMIGGVPIDECREYLVRAIERRLDSILAGDQS